jgi:hypothetical protein
VTGTEDRRVTGTKATVDETRTAINVLEDLEDQAPTQAPLPETTGTGTKKIVVEVLIGTCTMTDTARSTETSTSDRTWGRAEEGTRMIERNTKTKVLRMRN